ncbi:MAG: MFS transporter [Actinobacteria bacterium]|nr:MFS transporter [Actinomycetota bacterium]
MRRDSYTVGLYTVFIAWGWLLYSFNPSVSLLAEEQHVSGALAGLHGTAMAAGSLLAGWVAPKLVARTGRPRALVGEALLMLVGVVALLTGPGIAWTLSAMLVLSVGGVAMMSTATVGLARHQPLAASAVLSEANGVGSGVGLLAPLAVGVVVGLGWGWRPAVVVVVLILLGVAAIAWRTRDGEENAVPIVASRDKLPMSTGIWFLVALVAGISLEFATTFWSTALVREQTGASAGIATATTAGLLLGMTTARLVLGPVAPRFGPARMLAIAFVVAVVGWAVLWTASVTAVAVAGLVVLGAGIGLTAPLSQSMVLAAAGDHQDKAQGRSSVASGLAVGIAPFVLGALADQVGTHGAFVLVPVLGVLGVVASIAGGAVAAHRVAVPAVD